MKSLRTNHGRIADFLLVLGSMAGTVAAQQPSTLAKEREFIDSAGSMPWITLIIVGLIVIAGGVFLWKRKKSVSAEDTSAFENRYRSSRAGSSELEDVDAEQELEWFRKAKKSSSKSEVRNGSERRTGKRRLPDGLSAGIEDDAMQFDSKQFQDKMRKLQYAQLPINSFVQLTKARAFDQLPLSADPAVLSAIEQANEEYEEDEMIRELAVKILAAFRTRNSVEALSQIAVYDLSANLRSKAVQTLTEFDHESVFEAVLMACADPTREVRAAAARGLFRLNFDRAEAWKRIIATGDEYRMKHASRAAIESGIAQKSFDRLIHDDMRIAYEAFCLTGLLIRSGETDPIFEAISEHKDERVRYALLHVLKVVKDDRSIAALEGLAGDKSMTEELKKRMSETVKGIDAVPA